VNGKLAVDDYTSEGDSATGPYANLHPRLTTKSNTFNVAIMLDLFVELHHRFEGVSLGLTVTSDLVAAGQSGHAARPRGR
jgi:hypothetical protein